MTPLWLEAFLDLREDTYDAGATFWSAVTGYPRGPQRGPDGQFATLVPPEGLDYLLVQRLDDEQDAVTAHLDWSATDREAEIQQRHGLVGLHVMHLPLDDR